MEKPRYLSYGECVSLLRRLAAWDDVGAQWDWERGRVWGRSVAGDWSLRLPLSLPPVPLVVPASRYDGPPRAAQGLLEYALSLGGQAPGYLLVLIQAGHSAIGYFEGGEVVQHKVIKKYMVRGNGKSQVSYLSTRGKSKAGSRVRLANTVRFFEDINEKLVEWGVAGRARHIFVSCPVRMLPLWHGAEPAPPFGRDDARIVKVPMDVGRPDLEQLLHVARQLDGGFWEGEGLDGFLARRL